jgi:hypothetical protein
MTEGVASCRCHSSEQRAWYAEPLPSAPVELAVPCRNCELRNRKLGSPFSCVPLAPMAGDLKDFNPDRHWMRRFDTSTRGCHT